MDDKENGISQFTPHSNNKKGVINYIPNVSFFQQKSPSTLRYPPWSISTLSPPNHTWICCPDVTWFIECGGTKKTPCLHTVWVSISYRVLGRIQVIGYLLRQTGLWYLKSSENSNLIFKGENMYTRVHESHRIIHQKEAKKTPWLVISKRKKAVQDHWSITKCMYNWLQARGGKTTITFKVEGVLPNNIPTKGKKHLKILGWGKAFYESRQ